MSKKKLKRERAELLRLCEEMLEILDGAKTPVPEVEENPLNVGRLLIELRGVYLARPDRLGWPAHVNLRPEYAALLFLQVPFFPFMLGDDDTTFAGMKVHIDEPGRWPWEMW